MKKYFLIYGILLFLLFEKVCDIFIVLIKIINEKQDLSNSVIYIMLGISVIIPIMLFFLFLKKLNFNHKSLVLLISIYILPSLSKFFVAIILPTDRIIFSCPLSLEIGFISFTGLPITLIFRFHLCCIAYSAA